MWLHYVQYQTHLVHHLFFTAELPDSNHDNILTHKAQRHEAILSKSGN